MAVTEDGYVAIAELRLDTKPPAGQTVDIGADTYEFTDGAPAGANIAVSPGADAGASRTNLVTEINTNGTVAVKASVRAACVRIENADGVGGTPINGGGANVPLASGLNAVGNVWSRQNLDESGSNPTARSGGRDVVNSQNKAFGEFRFPSGIATIGECRAFVWRGGKSEVTWPCSAEGSDVVVSMLRTAPISNSLGLFLRVGDVVRWEATGV